MPAVLQDIKIEEGATFQMIIDATGYTGSLAGATAKMQVRPFKASTEVYLDVVPTVNSGTKMVTVNIPDEDTTDLDWRRGYYDVELYIGGDTYRLAEGRVTVSPEVTRS